MNLFCTTSAFRADSKLLEGLDGNALLNPRAIKCILYTLIQLDKKH